MHGNNCILKFDDFWNILVEQLATPKQFTTQTKPFSAKYLGGRIMVTTSDTLWPIDRAAMRQIWAKSISMNEKLRFIHTNYLQENIRTSSYIISLMKYFIQDESVME